MVMGFNPCEEENNVWRCNNPGLSELYQIEKANIIEHN